MTASKLAEAEKLLEEVASWSETEVESLPRFYREAAERYRKLANQGDTEPR
jgi:DICT domain-containing protein